MQLANLQCTIRKVRPIHGASFLCHEDEELYRCRRQYQ